MKTKAKLLPDCPVVTTVQLIGNKWKLLIIRSVRDELKKAIEQAQNFSTRYSENIKIGLGWRSAIYDLPQIMQEFSQRHPSVSITLLVMPVTVHISNPVHDLRGKRILRLA